MSQQLEKMVGRARERGEKGVRRGVEEETLDQGRFGREHCEATQNLMFAWQIQMYKS